MSEESSTGSSGHGSPRVVILAGGFGSRISEDSSSKPKPLLEIGGMPILWHIMKGFFSQGLDEFVILCGYKAYLFGDFFANYGLRNSDLVFDGRTGTSTVTMKASRSERWRVTVLDTGLNTMTGGRVKRARQVIGEEAFILTYGDGLADIDVAELLRFHHAHGKYATLTTVQPQGRFGFIDLDGDIVASFREKAQSDAGWVNGGFMVLEPEVYSLIDGDDVALEREPLERLADAQQLVAFRHTSFWQCMDTPRDHVLLENLWASGSPPWKNW